MLSKAVRALKDVLSPDFRTILWKSLLATIALFAALLVIAQAVLWLLLALPWPWLEAGIAVVAGLGMLAAFVFLMGPVTAVFAGLFVDEVAAVVEARHYPRDRPGAPPGFWTGLMSGAGFGLLVLVVNIALLPVIFLGIGFAIMLAANAYLLSREFFMLTASRHMSRAVATQMRRKHRLRIWISGILPAAMALVPIVNVIVPIFATAYFVHVFKDLDQAKG